MRVAAVVHDPSEASARTSVCWIDPEAGEVLRQIEVPYAANVEILPRQRIALVVYTTYDTGEFRCTTDIYRLEDWRKIGSLPTDCRAAFNGRQRWPTVYPSPDEDLAYVFKCQVLGDHLEADIVCGLDLRNQRFANEQFFLPENVIGWSGPGGRAHAQFLFSNEGLFDGRLSTEDLQQSVGFWLGPEQGMGPIVSIGPRPLAYSDLGHARAICSAGNRTVVIRNDGRLHLLDAVEFRQREVQHLQFPSEDVPVNYAVAIEPEARHVYIGVARHASMRAGIAERIVVHDLDHNHPVHVWQLDPPLQHFSMTEDGAFLLGAASGVQSLQMLNARTGRVENAVALDGSPQYVVATSEL